MLRTTEDGRVYRVTGDKPHLIDEDRSAAVEFVRQAGQ